MRRTTPVSSQGSSAIRSAAQIACTSWATLGAMAALMLAEQHPNQYDGALVMCGFVGGALTETAYAANARILFDYFFPSTLPGDAFNVPLGLQYAPGTPLFPRSRTH